MAYGLAMAYDLAMGSVHKFKRPPKNEQQFRGYRPPPPAGAARQSPARRRLRNWQKGTFVWSVLIVVATGLWALGKLF